MLKKLRNIFIGFIVAAAALLQLSILLPLAAWGVWEWQNRDWSSFQKQTDALFDEKLAGSVFTPGELFDFEWDEAYILRNGYGTGQELKEQYGLKFEIPDPLSDTQHRLLFFKDGQLIETKNKQFIRFFSNSDYLFESGMDGFYPETVLFAEPRRSGLYFTPLDPADCIWDPGILRRPGRDYPHFEHYWLYYQATPAPLRCAEEPPDQTQPLTRLQAAENVLKEFFDKAPQELQTTDQAQVAVLQAETQKYGAVKIVANDLYKDEAGNYYYHCLLWPGKNDVHSHWVDEVYVHAVTGQIFLPPPPDEFYQREYDGQIYAFDVERTAFSAKDIPAG